MSGSTTQPQVDPAALAGFAALAAPRPAAAGVPRGWGPAANPLTGDTPDLGGALTQTAQNLREFGQRQQQQAMDMGLLDAQGHITPAGIAQAQNVIVNGFSAGTVGGKGAVGANLDLLNIAKRIYGKPAATMAELWERNKPAQAATKWWKGPDDRWRFEIPDQSSTINPYFEPSKSQSQTQPLAHVLDHPDLYAAYPHLANLPLQTHPNVAPGTGYFDPQVQGAPRGQITMNWHPEGERNRGLLLHEIQHAIQMKEGFQQGGSPNYMDSHPLYRDAVTQTYLENTKMPANFEEWQQQRAKQIWGDKWQNYLGKPGTLIGDMQARDYVEDTRKLAQIQAKRLDPNAPFDLNDPYAKAARYQVGSNLYKRLFGEVEARAVTDRALRRQTIDRPFAENFDTPPNQHILWPPPNKLTAPLVPTPPPMPGLQ